MSNFKEQFDLDLVKWTVLVALKLWMKELLFSLPDELGWVTEIVLKLLKM